MSRKVRGIFLDISEVWHEVLIFKLCQNGTFGEMINILEEFLDDGEQKTV